MRACFLAQGRASLQSKFQRNNYRLYQGHQPGSNCWTWESSKKKFNTNKYRNKVVLSGLYIYSNTSSKILLKFLFINCPQRFWNLNRILSEGKSYIFYGCQFISKSNVKNTSTNLRKTCQVRVCNNHQIYCKIPKGKHIIPSQISIP